MKKLSKLMTLLVLPFIAFAVATIINPDVAKAHEDEKESTSQTTSKSNSYNYVAQPGDSYSLMARKAVQDYSKSNKSNLNQAQIIYAETTLTQAAGSPFLTEGQKVSIKKSDVKSAVDKAKKLSSAQITAWNEYAAGADFDTSHVGV